MSKTVVNQHYGANGHGPAVFMQKGLLRHIANLEQASIEIINDVIVALRNGPHNVNFEKLDYKIASDLYVLWESGFYFLYRVHIPVYGPFEKYQRIVHILDIDGYRVDADNNRILDLYSDPDAMRILAAQAGEIITGNE